LLTNKLDVRQNHFRRKKLSYVHKRCIADCIILKPWHIGNDISHIQKITYTYNKSSWSNFNKLWNHSCQ